MVAIGAVLLAFVACFLDSMSLAVWRLCALPMYNNSRVILLGYALQFSCMIGDLISLMYLSEFTHSVVDSFSVFSILIVSRYVLDEVASKIEIFGASCVVLGILICVCARPDAAHVMKYSAAISAFTNTTVVIWFFVLSGAGVGICYAIHPLKLERLIAVSAGLMGALTETLAKSMTLAAYEAKWKDVPLLLSIIIVYVFSEIYLIRLSLSVNPTYSHQPVFYATWALNGMISGGLVYGDFDVYASDKISLALTILGVGLLIFGCIVPLLNARGTRKKLNASAISSSFRHLAVTNPMYEDEYETFPTKTI